MIGDGMLRWARRVFDARTVETVIEPQIADLQSEWAEAIARGSHATARWIRMRAAWHFARTVALLIAYDRARTASRLPWVSLLLPAMGTAICGIVLVYAAGSGHHRAQSVYAALGVAAMLGAALVPARFLARSWIWAAIAAASIAASALPLGIEVDGARRWIAVAGLRIDVLELARPLVVIGIAGGLTAARAARGLLVAAACAFAMAGIAVGQHNPGGAAVVLATLGGAAWSRRRTRLSTAAFIAAIAVLVTATRASFPGPTGAARHTDGVLAGGIVAAFALLATTAVIAGLVRESRRATDDWRRAVAAAAAAGLAAQVAIFVAARAGLVADVGLALPMISYGGSSTVATLVTLGIVAARDEGPSRSAFEAAVS